MYKNTSIAIVVHAMFGAFGFIAIAFGGIHWIKWIEKPAHNKK